jgi:hypothetical protein
MINLDTTFVVGAGASVDYGFPLGEQLTKQIAEALNLNDSSGAPARDLVRTAIEITGARPDTQHNFCHLIMQARALRAALATASSIDAFLENHSDNPDFELLGKMAIAACLITAERRSQLRPRNPGGMIDFARVEKSWLARLFKIVMAPGVPMAALEQIFAHVSFVVFNYDRCIEHYFEQAIASHFTLDLPTAGQFVRQHLRIVHPYGDLGDLHGNTAVSFGYEHHPETHAAGTGIYAMSQRLLTFTESKKAQGAEAKAMIGKADRLVFLGFGFGEQNVDLLSVFTSASPHTRGTVMGLSKSNRHQVLYRIAQMTGITGGFNPNVELDDCDCASLINDEQMFLTRTS